MAIVYKNKEYRNLQEQVLENARNIAILQEKPGLKPVIVDELPETGEEGILYLVPSEDPEQENVYNEYVWVAETESFEMVGSTQVDLSSLVTLDTEQTITGEKTFSGDVNVQGDIDLSGELILGTGMSIKNHAPGSDNYLDLIQGNSNRMAVGSSIYSYVDFLPGANNSKKLGSDSMRWQKIYVEANGLDFGSNAWIQKDGSNRIIITNSGDAKIKVGVSEVICKDNFSPDQDASYSLGRSALRWGTLNVTNVANDYSSLQLKGKSGITITCDNGSAVKPSTNGQVDLGGSTATWNNIYANDIVCPTVAKKPDYSNPDVFEEGTLNASGQGTIDMTQTGMPMDGLYMFTYGNCQCFLSLTSTMIQNANTYPIRCPCPMMFNCSAYPGILKIERASDLLTLTVATAGVGNVQPAGFEWKLIKVM